MLNLYKHVFLYLYFMWTYNGESILTLLFSIWLICRYPYDGTFSVRCHSNDTTRNRTLSLVDGYVHVCVYVDRIVSFFLTFYLCMPPFFFFFFSPGTFGQERPENCASGVWQQRQSSGNMRTHRRRHWRQTACQTCPPAAASHSKKHRQSLSRPLYDVVAGKKKQWAAVVAKVSGMIVPCHCLFQYCVGLF